MKKNQKLPHWNQFLSPRHWPLWFFFFNLYVISHLPHAWMVRIGKSIGRILERCLTKSRRIVDINLRLCFPELSPAEQKNRRHKHFESIGLGFIEAGLAWWASDKQLKKISSLENGATDALQKNQQGTMFITGHFTTIELAARLISMVQPCYVFARIQNNDLFTWFLEKKRMRYLKGIVYKSDIKTLTKLLQDHETICYLPDQSYSGARHSVFAPFFGIPVATTTATQRIAAMTNALVIPGFLHRTDNDQHYVLNLQKPLDHFPSGDDEGDAARINAMIETAIRKHPEQYLWTHRRFKAQPDGKIVY